MSYLPLGALVTSESSFTALTEKHQNMLEFESKKISYTI